MCQDILLNTIQYRAIIKTKSIISHTVTPEKLLSVQVHFSVQNSEEKRKRLNGGTVPPFKMHPGGTLSSYYIYLFKLNLYCIAKINDR